MATAAEVVRVVTRAVQQELTMWTALLADLNAAVAAPGPGTPAAADAAWDAAQATALETTAGDLHKAAVRACGESLRTARDHVAAMCKLIDDPDLAIPALAATRAAQDALLPVLWLADPSVRPQERLVRSAAHYLDYVQEHHKLLVQFSRVVGDVMVDESWEQVREAQDTLESAGFVLRRHGGDARYVVHATLDGARAELKFNSTAAATRYTPGLARQYTVASGATHARMWLTPGMRIGGADTPAAIAMPLFDLTDYAADGMLPYLGIDPGPVHRKTHLRRVAIHETARPTTTPNTRLGYEEYAQRREAEAARFRSDDGRP